MPFVGKTVYVIDGATCDATDTSGCGVAPATVTLPSTGPVDANPFGIAVVEATNTIYTANLADGEFPGSASVIDGATCNGRDTSGCGQTPATAPTGFGTKDIAADPTTHDVYATNDEDTSVTTIDGDTCRGTRTAGCGHTITRPIVGDYPRSDRPRPGRSHRLRLRPAGGIAAATQAVNLSATAVIETTPALATTMGGDRLSELGGEVAFPCHRDVLELEPACE